MLFAEAQRVRMATSQTSLTPYPQELFKIMWDSVGFQGIGDKRLKTWGGPDRRQGRVGRDMSSPVELEQMVREIGRNVGRALSRIARISWSASAVFFWISARSSAISSGSGRACPIRVVRLRTSENIRVKKFGGFPLSGGRFLPSASAWVGPPNAKMSTSWVGAYTDVGRVISKACR